MIWFRRARRLLQEVLIDHARDAGFVRGALPQNTSGNQENNT